MKQRVQSWWCGQVYKHAETCPCITDFCKNSIEFFPWLCLEPGVNRLFILNNNNFSFFPLSWKLAAYKASTEYVIHCQGYVLRSLLKSEVELSGIKLKRCSTNSTLTTSNLNKHCLSFITTSNMRLCDTVVLILLILDFKLIVLLV